MENNLRFKVLLLISLFILSSKVAFACSCGGSNDLNASFQSASSVAIIKIVNTSIFEKVSSGTDAKTGKRSEYLAKYIKAEGKVIELLKGSGLTTVTMTGQTPNQGCYEFIETGADYLVFVNELGETSYTSCSNNQPLYRVPEELLEGWRK